METDSILARQHNAPCPVALQDTNHASQLCESNLLKLDKQAITSGIEPEDLGWAYITVSVLNCHDIARDSY